MRAAINEIRRDQPQKIIVAVPVMSNETAALFRCEADELVVLNRDQFAAVGACYSDFSQLSDKEVLSLLDRG
jgi:predicted phosphoribosyltransferase